MIIETGVAHGGSLVLHASLCKATGRGRVIGVDIEIRPHNRKAIESHFLFPYFTLIEGDSISPQVVSEVRKQTKAGEKVLVLLDSCHTKAQVLGELEAYAPMVSKGSYIVAMDGIMEPIVGAPRTYPDWTWNNPGQAALEFVATHPEFEIHAPGFSFNEGISLCSVIILVASSFFTLTILYTFIMGLSWMLFEILSVLYWSSRQGKPEVAGDRARDPNLLVHSGGVLATQSPFSTRG